jgi:GT2 family glycosyltransferase
MAYPPKAVSLAIVVVSYNNWAVLRRCLDAVRPVARALAATLIVVDHASPDGSAAKVAAEFPDVRLLRRPNNGFAAGVNAGVAATPASRVLLLNPDCILDGATALVRCLATLDEDPRIAAISCRVVDEDAKPNLPYRSFPTLRTYLAERLGARKEWERPAGHEPFDVDNITGAFFLLKREAWADVGPFDEGFFLYFEETDWCWRAKAAGWRIVHEPRAVVLHLGGQSTKTMTGEPIGARGLAMRRYLDSRERYWRKCYGLRATWAMRAASAGISLLSMAITPRKAAIEWFRIRHALHLL